MFERAGSICALKHPYGFQAPKALSAFLGNCTQCEESKISTPIGVLTFQVLGIDEKLGFSASVSHARSIRWRTISWWTPMLLLGK